MKQQDFILGCWYDVGECVSNIGGDYDMHFKPEKLTLEHIKFWADNDWTELDFGEFMAPIPLTDDIIKKNFSFNEALKCYKYRDVQIYPVDNSKDSWYIPNVPITLLYVHQLQLLLRLMGVDKEIELEIPDTYY